MTNGPSQVVIDASAVVSLLTADGERSVWVARTLERRAVAAPELLPYEVMSTLRRRIRTSEISAGDATDAINDLFRLTIELHSLRAFAGRAWELRDNVTPYDAAYVALAEGLGAPLMTLDQRLARSTAARCDFLTYEAV